MPALDFRGNQYFGFFLDPSSCAYGFVVCAFHTGAYVSVAAGDRSAVFVGYFSFGYITCFSDTKSP